jgi:hypothetical protein
MDSRSMRQMNNETKQEQYKTSGSGGMAEWNLRWKFDTRPIHLHLIAPEEPYQDPYDENFKAGYRRLIRHFFKFLNNGKGGYLECAGDHCVTDALLNPTKFGLNLVPDANLRKSHQLEFSFAVAGVIEEWFHLVEKPNKKKDGTYMTRELCLGRGCPHCQAQGPKNRVFGKRFYTTFSNGAWFYEMMPTIELAEKHCKCGGQIYIPEYVCPKCQAQLIDVASSCEYCSKDATVQPEIELDLEAQTATCKTCNTSWTLLESADEKLRGAVDAKYHCNCGYEGHAYPKQICTNCEDPQPLGIFDISMVICKESDKQQAKTQVKSWEIKELDPRLFDPQFQGAFEGASTEQVAAAEGAAQRMKKPVDLDRIFTIESTSKQAATLGKPDPFGGSDAAVGQGGEQNFAAGSGQGQETGTEPYDNN